ncbi:MAG: hypothetical protein NVS2B4_11750 [Ramlibacter sp.]
MAAALAAAAGGSARAQEPGIAYGAVLGVAHRTLTERSQNGDALLTERGWLPQARVSLRKEIAGGGAVAAMAGLAGADLNYRGQTQAGAPLSTTTRQTEWTVDGLWRPVAPAQWGQAWLSGHWLGNRRAIESTPTAGGLDETSQALLLGARWTGPDFATVAGWQSHLEADARISVGHRLGVDYRGLLDASTLTGARKHQWSLRLIGGGVASPWGWEVEAARLAQAASQAVPVYRGGALFGTVRQPALTIEDVTLRISRRF